MAVRIKDGEVPYTWWVGIEITNNHVINVLLRELNNLIHVNEDRELYVDLQLDAGIEPDDDFPVWVTTWKILAEDWRPQNGTIINWKTTSGDYTRIIYAGDGNLYYDPWTWVWNKFLSSDDLTIATATEPWLIKLGSDTKQTEAIQTPTSTAWRTYAVQLNNDNQAMVNVPWSDTTYQSRIEDEWGTDVSLVTTGEKYIWNHKQNQLTAWTRITITTDPQTGDTIISADVSGVLTYKWNVSTINDLPSSWQSIWDTYFVEWADAMYSWDGTQWNMVGGTGINLNDYFNKTTDDSDDIIQWSTHLFCTTLEKTTWNNKQEQIIAWNNITINADWKTINSASYYAGTWLSLNNHTFTNTNPFDPANEWSLGWLLQKTSEGYEWRQPNFVTSVNWETWAVTVDEFDPENAGSTGQVLKKTATGYEWSNEKAGVYTSWDWISINSASKTITNTKPFDPNNTGSTWQVLKRDANGYSWQNEWWGGGWGWNFNPQNEWTAGQVLTKTVTGYNWQSIEWGEWNVKLFTLNSISDTTNAQAALDWTLAWKMPIIKYNNGVQDTYYILQEHHAWPELYYLSFSIYLGPWTSLTWYKFQVFETINITYDWTQHTVTNITHNLEELNKTWIGTQSDYESLPSYLNWVVYNILPNS